MINHSPHLLLITDNSVNLLVLSNLLVPIVHVLPVRLPDALRIPEGFTDLFVYDPSPALLARLKADPKYTTKVLDLRGKLWRLSLPLPQQGSINR